jgi:RNA polymerase sigma-54 factor
MNNLELQAYIEEEFAKNPFLARQDRYCGGYDFADKIPGAADPSEEIFRETAFLSFGESEKKIVEMLIHSIGDGEYLNGDVLKYVADEKKINYADLLKIVFKLKKTSFSSMFTFNLQDRLKTFLENENLYTDIYQKLVRDINLIFSGNWSMLQARCGISKDELSAMVFRLKDAFASVDFRENVCLPRNVDLVVTEELDDEFKITVDETALIEVEFDRELYVESLKSSRTESDKSYVKKNASAAKLLIKSVNSRNSTLMKIAGEIIYRQTDFFLRRNAQLIPISTKTVACALSLHESTINRALANKTVATPRGIFELKNLLPRKMKSRDNEISDYSIKEYMRALISTEPKDDPYSDDIIAGILGSDCGISISRRTVSKYRDILNIPNVTKRIRNYKIATCV